MQIRIVLWWLMLGLGSHAIAGAGEFTFGSFGYSSIEREYGLYVPPKARTHPTFLVVALHGCLQDAKIFSQVTQLNTAADSEGFIVLYPQEPGGFRACFEWWENGNQSRGQGVPALIAELTSAIAKRFQIPNTKTFLLGFSAGGGMAINLAVCYPDHFSAVGVQSAYPYAATTGWGGLVPVMKDGMYSGKARLEATLAELGSLAKAVPLLSISSDRDKIAHPNNQSEITQQFKFIGERLGHELIESPGASLAATPDNHGYDTKYFIGERGVVITEILVHHLEHAWSGGPESLTGVDPKGPPASKIIIDFFKHEIAKIPCEKKIIGSPK